MCCRQRRRCSCCERCAPSPQTPPCCCPSTCAPGLDQRCSFPAVDHITPARRLGLHLLLEAALSMSRLRYAWYRFSMEAAACWSDTEMHTKEPRICLQCHLRAEVWHSTAAGAFPGATRFVVRYTTPLSHDTTSIRIIAQDCGTIQLLEPFLEAGRPAEGVAQALAALDNLCKISRTRQEAAAVSGVVPHLVRLAAPSVGFKCFKFQAL